MSVDVAQPDEVDPPTTATKPMPTTASAYVRVSGSGVASFQAPSATLHCDRVWTALGRVDGATGQTVERREKAAARGDGYGNRCGSDEHEGRVTKRVIDATKNQIRRAEYRRGYTVGVRRESMPGMLPRNAHFGMLGHREKPHALCS